MCGIAGIAFNDTTRRADEAMLARMVEVMRYRGPDSQGFHNAPSTGLGVCRLSSPATRRDSSSSWPA